MFTIVRINWKKWIVNQNEKQMLTIKTLPYLARFVIMWLGLETEEKSGVYYAV